MIFNNLELNDPKIELFLCHIVGRTLPKYFILSTDGNNLKVDFGHIDFCPVEYFSALQPEISPFS